VKENDHPEHTDQALLLNDKKKQKKSKKRRQENVGDEPSKKPKKSKRKKQDGDDADSNITLQTGDINNEENSDNTNNESTNGVHNDRSTLHLNITSETVAPDKSIPSQPPEFNAEGEEKARKKLKKQKKAAKREKKLQRQIEAQAAAAQAINASATPRTPIGFSEKPTFKKSNAQGQDQSKQYRKHGEDEGNDEGDSEDDEDDSDDEELIRMKEELQAKLKELKETTDSNAADTVPSPSALTNEQTNLGDKPNQEEGTYESGSEQGEIISDTEEKEDKDKNEPTKKPIVRNKSEEKQPNEVQPKQLYDEPKKDGYVYANPDAVEEGEYETDGEIDSDEDPIEKSDDEETEDVLDEFGRSMKIRKKTEKKYQKSESGNEDDRGSVELNDTEEDAENFNNISLDRQSSDVIEDISPAKDDAGDGTPAKADESLESIGLKETILSFLFTKKVVTEPEKLPFSRPVTPGGHPAQNQEVVTPREVQSCPVTPGDRSGQNAAPNKDANVTFPNKSSIEKEPSKKEVTSTKRIEIKTVGKMMQKIGEKNELLLKKVDQHGEGEEDGDSPPEAKIPFFETLEDISDAENAEQAKLTEKVIAGIYDDPQKQAEDVDETKSLQDQIKTALGKKDGASSESSDEDDPIEPLDMFADSEIEPDAWSDSEQKNKQPQQVNNSSSSSDTSSSSDSEEEDGKKKTAKTTETAVTTATPTTATTSAPAGSALSTSATTLATAGTIPAQATVITPTPITPATAVTENGQEAEQPAEIHPVACGIDLEDAEPISEDDDAEEREDGIAYEQTLTKLQSLRGKVEEMSVEDLEAALQGLPTMNQLKEDDPLLEDGRRTPLHLRDIDIPIKTMVDYIDDKKALYKQVFKSINKKEFKAMLPKPLQKYDVRHVRNWCLDELEIMSKKRIRAIILQQYLASSSSEDDDKVSSDDSETAEGESKKEKKGEEER